MVRFYATIHMKSGRKIRFPATSLEWEKPRGKSNLVSLSWDQPPLFKLRTLDSIDLDEIEAITTARPFWPINAFKDLVRRVLP